MFKLFLNENTKIFPEPQYSYFFRLLNILHQNKLHLTLIRLGFLGVCFWVVFVWGGGVKLPLYKIR